MLSIYLLPLLLFLLIAYIISLQCNKETFILGDSLVGTYRNDIRDKPCCYAKSDCIYPKKRPPVYLGATFPPGDREPSPSRYDMHQNMDKYFDEERKKYIEERKKILEIQEDRLKSLPEDKRKLREKKEARVAKLEEEIALVEDEIYYDELNDNI